ncbi:hydrolase [Denitrobaculum tricleocarpae]|uniref:Hydrolase n=1 Tax=Denitrobaculum tricleocarpae TaxID=2591009 RepID=A0A545TUT5_9PROT|nr:hydrolase [Denitrobaculum tricleocarpae]
MSASIDFSIERVRCASVCGREDDNVQADNPDRRGGANTISLNEAKATFSAYGAISQLYVMKLRKPRLEEIPPSSASGMPNDN